MIKRAEMHNLLQITALWRQHVSRGAAPHTPSDGDYAYWASIIRDPSHVVVVRTERKNVVGFCHSRVVSPQGFPGIAVVEEVVGDKEDEMLNMTISWARESGLGRLAISSPVGSKNKAEMEGRGFKAVSINYMMEV